MSQAMSRDALERITELVQPSLRQCGVDLFDAQWDGSAGLPVLRLLIEKPGGVSLDDCERVSLAVGAVLDAYDPIEGAYQLEVSSPGAERPLRGHEEWRRHVGDRVNVRYRSGDVDTVVEGRLLAVEGDAVEVEVRDRRSTRAERIAMSDVLAGRLAVDI
jgi:ribosome maturation factor RimP